MRFLFRSLVGLFLLATTVVLLGVAGYIVQDALQERLNAEPRSFPQRERVIAVNAVTLEPQTLTPEMTVYGELRSRRAVDLRTATGGIVLSASEALVEGGAVAAGDFLVQIDPADAIAARDRTQADVQDAEAELRDAGRALELARDELAAAREQAKLRDQALLRARDLEARGVGTAAAVEAAELAASSADASVLTRRQALANAEARVDLAQTRLSRAQIALAEAERTVDDTTGSAAFDGVLAEVSLTTGGRVAANERFARLIDPSDLEVSFRLSTAQYARLVDGAGQLVDAPVTVSLDASGVALETTGRIDREGATVGEGQTGRLIFAQLDPAPGFRPGDFVTIRIEEPELMGVALVPATALGPDGSVLVIDAEDRLQLAHVEVLRRQGDDALVLVGGLNGARIVAERSPLLGEGIKVRPIGVGLQAETAEAEMITLDPDRRAKLIAFVTDGRMPEDVKAGLITQLQAEEVSAQTVARLERRMGS